MCRFPKLTLGALLGKEGIASALDSATLKQALLFAQLNNAAKHDFGHAKDTHMFSYQDALNSYFVCRRLALRIYPLANLGTDMRVFDVAPADFDARNGHLTSTST